MKKDGEVNPYSLCTLSQNLDHSPGAIWAHMQPIFAFVNSQLNEVITCILFLSDGPSTQYRNRTAFYLLQHRLRSSFPNVTMGSWNYSEAGHGKGAPDGVGGTIKRTAADKIVLLITLSQKLHNVLLLNNNTLEGGELFHSTNDRIIA